MAQIEEIEDRLIHFLSIKLCKAPGKNTAVAGNEPKIQIN